MNREEEAAAAPRERWAKWFTATVAAVLTGAVITSGHAETLTVTSFGIGQTPQAAIDKALEQAVEQVTGVKLQVARGLSESVVSVDGGDRGGSRVTEAFQQEARQQAGGIVKSFDIVSVELTSDSFVARLNVGVERYAPPGLPTQDRRRIIVAPPVNLANLAPSETAVLRDALEAYLVQTRRFAILDRQNDSAYRSEMELLKSPDVPISEAARIGQVIGADYVLLTKMRQLESTTQEAVLPITGQRESRTSSRATADFVVVEIGDRQVKWAGQVVNQTAGDRDAALRSLASQLGENVVSDIYPLRVIQVVAPNSLVIDQGADTIRVGQTFSANLLGEMALDPYTKEPLGRIEKPIGTVKISRVDPKLSYGEMIAGSLPTGDFEIVLRSQTPPSETHSDRTGGDTNSGPRPRW